MKPETDLLSFDPESPLIKKPTKGMSGISGIIVIYI